ncbi:MAG TPA: response regulator [Phycisphaerales bacterium]|nr:response regulator [Phycisphaerales bacterium]
MAQVKIVVVDDDEDIRQALQAVLESKDYAVITAENKEDGMRAIAEEKPALAILDVMMGTWQDGFDMAREIKSDPELKDTLILMLTGVEDKTGLEFKSAAGDPDWMPVEGFLDKPVDSDVLLAEVEKLLKG